jgi:hypothetical protein
MIVKDELTRQEAINLCKQNSQVFYSDKNLYSAIVKSPEMLRYYITRSFNSGEISIVGAELQKMELFDYELKMFKQQQQRQEMKDAHTWFKTHPREVAKVVSRVEARERANA